MTRLLVARVTIEKYLTEDGDEVDVQATTADADEGLDVVEALGLCAFAQDDLLRQARGEG